MSKREGELRAEVDAEERRLIEEDLDRTLVVEAAAGTGKTTAMVRRMVAVLKSGKATLDAIVAVTFTEKAAGEMKLRLRAEVERARTHPDTLPAEKARLDAALEELEAARIGTIHSFCADLLHERPVEARVDPIFDMAATDEAERLFDQAFNAWFELILADPPEGVRRLLRRRPQRRDDDGPRETLRTAGLRLVDHRDFDAPWRRDPFDRATALDAIVLRLGGVAELASRCDDREDWLVQSLRALGRFHEELARREAVRGARDYDGLEAEVRTLARERHWRWKGRGKMLGEGVERSEGAKLRDGLKAEIDAFLAAAEADLAACLHAELRPLVAAFEALKARAGKLDFLDLLARSRDLVRDDASVRNELQERITHLFIDEFQDTDPLQAEILLLLAADDPAETDWTKVRPKPGKLFVVGDPKQSIYRFRRADVALYQQVKERLLAAGAEDVYLKTSYRSVPAIQGAVNAAFAKAMEEGPSQARYVALETSRPERPTQPSVIVLPVPRPYSHYGRITKWSIEESVPDAVAAFVEWLVKESGYLVSEKDDEGKLREDVKLEPRHVCLLLKRFQSGQNDITRAYVEALEARGVKHVLVGGRSFHAREEIRALRNALTAIEWPEDELAVYATLRGPFVALADDALLAYRHRFRSLNPFRAPSPKEGEATLEAPYDSVVEALAALRKLHVGRNRRPIADTVSRLLETTRAHAGIAIWPAGEQALANLSRVMDLARRFEAGAPTSFRAFVERLEEQAERGDAAEAPVVEEGTEGVRLMTVHRAKGLEFPVVVLADPTAVATSSTPSRHVEPDKRLWAEPIAWCAPRELIENADEARRRDHEESIRLAYVAATRARDLLVVPLVGDEPLEPTVSDDGSPGWIDVLRPALFPAATERRSAGAVPGLAKPFGDDSVYERPAEARKGASASVKPGLHRPALGTHEVVWWDPKVLALDKQHDVGLRQQRLLAADADGVVSNEGVLRHEKWQKQRRANLEEGARPSLLVRTVTEISHDETAPDLLAPAAAAAAEESEDDSIAPMLFDLGPKRTSAPALEPVSHERVTQVRDRARPHGKRFGTLVHALLATVALDAAEDDVRLAAEEHARLLGAPADEAEAAAGAVVAALRHPLLERAARAAASGGLRREVAVLVKLDDGSLAEGVVDLAFREEKRKKGAWTVVDFKTDVEVAGRLESYERQVRLYARAIAAATGETASGVLLSV